MTHETAVDAAVTAASEAIAIAIDADTAANAAYRASIAANTDACDAEYMTLSAMAYDARQNATGIYWAVYNATISA